MVARGDEAEVLWRKFRFLVPLALLTSLHRATLGDALARDPVVTGQVIAEVAATATLAGLPATPTELGAIMRGLPAAMRSSLEQDLSAGRTTELTAIGGDLLAAAARLGVPVPTCSAIVQRLGTP